ncbi:MAG: cell division protein ZapA [Bacteroidetes bacterium MedPE-SWsnd-G1]|uniref:Cell division protein ZapA n=1 Tax=Urechidicola vernalis TaxID=3075600 RepID=A0ABU2Y2B6_9FLAO|nr:cell division protein ZapA [Urechidicola sp. P050]MDT0552290.1 cell division protein ZapA [Urechidicola sp. P050]OIQ38707.1 MAG: cell division protein ZapA [Bacteroidetes bacterium MedPE-SWsnd-G1]
MDKLKIKITIGGRVYPLSVNSANEEEGMRKAAKKINDLIQKFEQNYAVSDKQDVLAMCALQFAAALEIQTINKDSDLEEATKKIETLNQLVSSHLK